MHKIHFVDDGELPEGHDFMLLTSERGALIFYRRSALTPSNLEDSWAAYRAVRERKPTAPATLPTTQERHLGVVQSRRLA